MISSRRSSLFLGGNLIAPVLPMLTTTMAGNKLAAFDTVKPGGEPEALADLLAVELLRFILNLSTRRYKVSSRAEEMDCSKRRDFLICRVQII
jgi:hypothetical protein